MADLKVLVLGLYGAKDDSIHQSALSEMRGKLLAFNLKTARESEIFAYPDAAHAYAAHAFFAD